MSYSIIPSESFSRNLKKLAKKYPLIKEDILTVISSLQDNPRAGTPLGNDCYKIRMKITGKRSGKSGAARIITYVVTPDNAIYLIAIYDKTNTSTYTDTQIQDIINKL